MVHEWIFIGGDCDGNFNPAIFKMSLLLLTDEKVCPACRKFHRISERYGECRNCRMRLWKFYDPDIFMQYEKETGWREWHCYRKGNGWMHRSHVLDENSEPLEKPKPLERVYKAPDLPSDYGTASHTKRRLAESRFELKEEIRQIKKKKRRKYSIGTRFSGRK